MLRKCIVIPEDTSILEAFEKSFLQRNGFSILVASSGQKAYQLIEEEDPCLVFLDLEMSDLSGDQCCRMVKKDTILRHTPVVLVCPQGDMQQAQDRCRNAGCDSILYRPVQAAQLEVAACELLRIQRRALPRRAVQLPVKYGPGASEMTSGVIRNINGGGIFLEGDPLYPVNKILTIRLLSVGSSGWVEVKGRVAWVNHPEWIKVSSQSPGMGIEFLALDESKKEALRAMVD